MKNEIIWLSEAKESQQSLVGSKALKLAKLSRLSGIQVPPGFIITTYVHKQARKHGLRVETSFANQLSAAFKKLGSRYVAVRSSSPAEDGQQKSFAGLFTTRLNVGEGDLVGAVEECWQAATESQLQIYSGKSALPVAILVQPIVNSRIAGVMFTADPITGKQLLLIESIYGLGEPLMQGSLRPDSFQVSKTSGKVLAHHRHQQRTRLIASGGKMRQIALSKQQQQAATLCLSQIAELARAAKRIHSFFRRSQDIEWAIADDKLYILQSRPIIMPPSSRQKKNLWTHAWLRGGTILEESLNLVAQAVGLREEIGDGYDHIIIVKDRGGYVPSVQYEKVEKAKSKLKPVFSYIPRSQAAEAKLERLLAKPQVDFELVFSLIIRHLAWYGLAKKEAESLYNNMRTSHADVKSIERWRNQEHFGSYDQLWKRVGQVTGVSVGDIDLLTIDELRQLLRGVKRNWRPLIAARRAATWSLIGNNGRAKLYLKDMSPLLEPKAKSRIIKGQVAFGIDKPVRGTVGKDIIVTVMTSPAAILNIKRAKALVTDEGGILSHAAILCRELKIPCIIGTGNATRLLRRGDVVEIDTVNGLIKQLAA